MIAPGRLQGMGQRTKADIADDVLVCRNTKLAVIEAKVWDKAHTEGLGQAKNYAAKLSLRSTYSMNGQAICGVEACARPGPQRAPRRAAWAAAGPAPVAAAAPSSHPRAAGARSHPIRGPP